MLLNRFLGLFNRYNYRPLTKVNRLVAPKSSYAASPPKDKEVEELDAPIKFTNSAARHYKAKSTRLGYETARLWYEPYVILASISVFLVYFLILREENDIDEELGKSLYSRVEGLEEIQLKLALEYNRQHNLDTTAIIARMKELEVEKHKKEESKM